LQSRSFTATHKTGCRDIQQDRLLARCPLTFKANAGCVGQLGLSCQFRRP
jgi:hypothetical protein